MDSGTEGAQATLYSLGTIESNDMIMCGSRIEHGAHSGATEPC